ncbi:MAG: CarD family transcriptional regulator [Gammaproteobacteria bacterium]|nr:CarD family transcriptional regulator [Gammaproteobacteria bacterium]
MAKRPRFKVGETIFYPSAGVGTIQAIEELYVAGDFKPCLVIHIAETRMTVKVPQDNVEKCGIRPLLTNRKLKELFKVLSAKGRQRVTGGNWTERCKEIERKINSGSCLELGEVVRDLMRWKKQSGLSFEESMLLETASGYLAREIAAVQGIETAVAFDRIRDCIGVETEA